YPEFCFLRLYCFVLLLPVSTMVCLASALAIFLSRTSAQKPFSDQKGSRKKRNLHVFKEISAALADGDLYSLVHSYFDSYEGQALFEQLVGDCASPYAQVLQNINPYQLASPKVQKVEVLSLVCEEFSWRTLKRKWF